MGVTNILEATLTPSGEKRIAVAGKQGPKVYIYDKGGVFEVESVGQGPELVSSEPPTKILFGAIVDPRLRVKTSIPIDISRAQEAVVAYSPELEEFGYGPSLSEALDDFGKTICELYFSLEGKEEKLGDSLKKLLAVLRTYLEPRRVMR